MTLKAFKSKAASGFAALDDKTIAILLRKISESDVDKLYCTNNMWLNGNPLTIRYNNGERKNTSHAVVNDVICDIIRFARSKDTEGDAELLLSCLSFSAYRFIPERYVYT